MLDIENIKSLNESFKGKETLSISNILNQLVEEFNQDEIAEKTYNKHFEDQNSIYYHKDKENIIEMWNEKANKSRIYGSLLDQYSNLILNQLSDNEINIWKLNHNFETDNRLKNLCLSFNNFYDRIKNSDYKYVAREIPLYYNYENILVKGRFDCLFYNSKIDEYLLVDWKTNETIKTNNIFQKCLGPISNYDNCDIVRYTLQTHFYKLAFLETYHLCSPNKIKIRIIQFLSKIINNENTFNVYKEFFNYDKTLLDNIIKFSKDKINLKNL